MRFTALRNFKSAKVDRANSRINGMSIVTIGDARGHNVKCDRKTLEQVMSCAQQYASGLKVKFNPETFDHGHAGIAGRFDPTSYRIVGNQLTGDLIVAKNYAHREYLFELAEDQPDTFGLSMEFNGPSEIIGDHKFARCDEIFAATVVDLPAANKAGLFRVCETANNQTNTGGEMTADELTAAITGALKPLSDRLDKIEKGSSFTTPTDQEFSAAGCLPTDDDATKRQKVQTYRDGLDKPVTGRDLMKFFSMAGGKAAQHNGGEGAHDDDADGAKDKDGKVTHKFTARVQKYRDSGMSKEVATFRAREDAPEDYNDFVTNGEPKETAKGAK